MKKNKREKEPLLFKEFEAKTVEEAIKEALAELKIPKERLKIQILSEGQRGLFGMQGAKKAKIRVTILSE